MTGSAPASRRHSERHRRALAAGMCVSVVLHAALVLASREETGFLPFSTADGPLASDPIAAGNGSAMQVIRVAPPRPIQVPPPPSTAPSLEAPEVTELVPQDARLSGARLVSLAPASGASAGRSADVGADGRGTHRRTLPVPRVVIPEWNPPKEVRGTEVPIRVLVGEDGSTLRVELPAPTRNQGFNRKLLETYGAMDWFPATRGGRAVSEWTQVTLSF